MISFYHKNNSWNSPLKHLGAGDLQVDHDRRQAGFHQLTRVVDRVAEQSVLYNLNRTKTELRFLVNLPVHYDDLHAPAQLEDPLDLRLHLGQVVCSRAGFLEHFPIGGIVQNRRLPETQVRAHVGDDDPSLELVLQKLKNCFLQHVRHLVAFQAGSDHDHRPHDWHHIIWRPEGDK